MTTEFQRSLAQVLKEEGGYSNNPHDSGKQTMRGVTQAVYDSYRASYKLSPQPVKIITETELEDIYRSRYWDLAKCDALPTGVSYVVFDGAVNSGVSQSAKWLQRALGVNVDGVIGPATLAAAKAISPSELIDKICDARLNFLKALTTYSTFGKGWSARVARVRKTGKAWAVGNSTPTLPIVNNIEGATKARVTDAKPSTSTIPGDAAASAGGTGVTLSAILYAAKDQLTPFQGQSAAIDKIIAGIVVVSLVVAVGGLAYRFWAARKKAEHKEDLGVPNV